jgi:hypothetical protein
MQIWNRCIPTSKQTIKLIRASAITISSHEGVPGILCPVFPRIDAAVEEADEFEVEAVQRSHRTKTGGRRGKHD